MTSPGYYYPENEDDPRNPVWADCEKCGQHHRVDVKCLPEDRFQMLEERIKLIEKALWEGE